MLHCLCYIYTHTTFLFYIIAYDWRTGNGKYTISVSGYCTLFDEPYDTLMLPLSVVTINKFLQIMMFSAYLVYYYKFNKNVVRPAQVSLQYSRKIFQIAIVMGATVGLTYFVAILDIFIIGQSDIIFIVGRFFLLIHQIVILASLKFTKKMFVLCKAYFLRDKLKLNVYMC